MFQIGIVGGNDSFYVVLVQGMQDGFGDGSPQHGFCSRPEFVNEYECVPVSVPHKVFHVNQMGAVGTQVVFNRLFVADVYQDMAEDSEAAGFIDGDGQAALEHVLQQTGSLQADGFSSGVGTGNQDDALFFVDFYVQRN